MRLASISVRAARCIVVGITSLEDWPLFTWSLGWTIREPMSPPMISEARLAMTSLAFMFVEVPEPVWKTSRTKVIVKLAIDDLLGGLDNGVFLVEFQQSEAGVNLGGGELYQAEGSDEGTGEP